MRYGITRYGGYGRIRTYGTLTRTTPFQGVTIDHSVTYPIGTSLHIYEYTVYEYYGLCYVFLESSSAISWFLSLCPSSSARTARTKSRSVECSLSAQGL